MTDDVTDPFYLHTRRVILASFRLIRGGLRQRWVLGSALALAAVGGALAPRLLPPIYEGRTVLVYRETLALESLVTGEGLAETWNDKRGRYIDLVTSRPALERVVADLELYPDVRARGGLPEAVEELRRNLYIDAPSEQTLSISFSTKDRGALVPVLQRFEQEFKERPAQDAAARAEATSRFANEEYERATIALSEREQSLAQFLTLHPEFAVDTAGAPTLGTLVRAQQSDGQVSRTSALLRAQQRSLRDQLASEQAAAGKPTTSLQPSQQSERASAAEIQAEAARRQLEQLRSRFTEAHPDVVAALAEVRKREQEAERMRAAAAADRPMEVGPVMAGGKLAWLRSRLDAVEEAIAQEDQSSKRRSVIANRAAADDIVSLETRWASLNRDVAAAREHHEAVGQRLAQATTLLRLTSSGGHGELSTLDPPFEPLRPARRGARRTAAIAAVFVALLGAVIAVLKGWLDGRVVHEDELRSLGLSAVTVVIAPLSRRELRALGRAGARPS